MWNHSYKSCHTRGDAVAVKGLLLGQLDAFTNGLVTGLFGIESRSETSSTLLVHLGSRCDTIDSHEEELLGFNLAKQMFNVVEYADEHFLLAEAKGYVFTCILVGTVMNDTIHIQLNRG